MTSSLDNPNLLCQDCNRKLFKWFLHRGDSRRILKEMEKESVPKFVSEWFKTMDDYTFPEGMPEDVAVKVIARRRQILVYAYLMFGIGEECMGSGLWSRICRELQDIQAAWGHEFNFYDWIFDGWDQTKEDHLPTNRGIDNGVVNHALGILSTRKAAKRRLELALAV